MNIGDAGTQKPALAAGGKAPIISREAPTYSSSRPIEIGRGGAAGGAAPVRATPMVPFSAPVARAIPPAPPMTRPSIPLREPPLMDLPPSQTTRNYDEIFEAATKPRDDSTPTGTDMSSAKPIPTAGSGSSGEVKQDQAAAAKPSGWGVARSLTNNFAADFAAAASGIGKLQVGGQSGAMAVPAQKPAMDMGVGRSPTILSFMNGTDAALLLGGGAAAAGSASGGAVSGAAFGSAGGSAQAPVAGSVPISMGRPAGEPLAVSSRNPAFRGGAAAAAAAGAGAGAGPTMGVGRPLAPSLEDEDEDDADEDADMEPQPLVDDELQFNITLDSS